jgi:hypothetical protein
MRPMRPMRPGRHLMRKTGVRVETFAALFNDVGG